MINLIKDIILSFDSKIILELGTGYSEDIHEEIGKKNRLILSDINTIYIKTSNYYEVIYLDANNVNISDESVDIVFSSMLIPYIKIENHLNEVNRILKPGGKYYFAVTGIYHNKEINYMRNDLRNISSSDMMKFGVNVYKEDMYIYKFKNIEDIVLYAKRCGINNKITPKNFQLTKHFIVFEYNKNDEN